jgi:hypothetical protein
MFEQTQFCTDRPNYSTRFPGFLRAEFDDRYSILRVSLVAMPHNIFFL